MKNHSKRFWKRYGKIRHCALNMLLIEVKVADNKDEYESYFDGRGNLVETVYHGNGANADYNEIKNNEAKQELQLQKELRNAKVFGEHDARKF